MRASRPYVERIDGLPDVQAGERVERDDGWWRAVQVTVTNADLPVGTYRSSVRWVPIEPVFPYEEGSLEVRINGRRSDRQP